MKDISMETDGDRTWLIIALLVLIALLRAWYSACETALTEINDAVVHARAEQDDAWKPLDHLISAPTRMRRCFTMHRIFSAILAGILCWLLAGRRFAGLFPFRDGVLISALLLTLGLMLLMSILTDMFPKRIARHCTEKLARFCVPTVRGLMLIELPDPLSLDGLRFCFAAHGEGRLPFRFTACSAEDSPPFRLCFLEGGLEAPDAALG